MMQPENSLPYVELGRRLGLSEDGVKSAARRLRKRIRDIFREQLALQVDNPADVDEEIRHLIEVLANPSC